MTELLLTPKRAKERLRLSKGSKPRRPSGKERNDLLERYSLDDLVGYFGRWPTYYLLLRHVGSGKSGKFAAGVGFVGIVVSIVVLYLKRKML
jgi:hypothetical protein